MDMSYFILYIDYMYLLQQDKLVKKYNEYISILYS